MTVTSRSEGGNLSCYQTFAVIETIDFATFDTSEFIVGKKPQLITHFHPVFISWLQHP